MKLKYDLSEPFKYYKCELEREDLFNTKNNPSIQQIKSLQVWSLY